MIEATSSAAGPASEAAAPDPERPLGRRGWAAVAACVIVANAALVQLAFRGPAPATLTGPRFEDRFERSRLGPGWHTTGGHWRIVRGELFAPGPKNNPLWLELALPREVAIEFDARSETGTGDRAGDIKFEVFGDGRDHASGYVCVFGGWGNQLSAIARLDEHGQDRKERRDRKVVIGRTYHMRVERRGNALRWLVDGAPFLSFDDPAPLSGAGHDRFGFSGWEADTFFDNLRIAPL
ncbi:MAG TPA: hypothetical protein VFE30_10105 [Anaeromyxobacteraceae bacterium]|jgi:hypothetical protein|nr:hypothetical protein [Anaeromyxobacteraceae bacterium]